MRLVHSWNVIDNRMNRRPGHSQQTKWDGYTCDFGACNGEAERGVMNRKRPAWSGGRWSEASEAR